MLQRLSTQNDCPAMWLIVSLVLSLSVVNGNIFGHTARSASAFSGACAVMVQKRCGKHFAGSCRIIGDVHEHDANDMSHDLATGRARYSRVNSGPLLTTERRGKIDGREPSSRMLAIRLACRSCRRTFKSVTPATGGGATGTWEMPSTLTCRLARQPKS